MLNQEVLNYKESILNDLATLVSYNSIYVPNENGTPFGVNNKACLEKALEIARGYGFKAVNLDDYCGYVEMGQGEEIIGILAHLDVVPVSDSWATDPFKLTFINDKYYGRGTSDDKGAVCCSLAALRMLKEKESTFKKRVRLILGCNEESGSRGVEHYIEKEGHVNCGFTPDGEFPLVFGEKGMVDGLLKGRSEKIADIKAGTVANVVAANCTIKLNGTDFDQNKLTSFFQENHIDFTLQDNTLTVHGVAAHASLPEKGVNAISYAMEGLYQAGLNDPLTDIYHKLISLDYNGKNAGVGFEDEYGKLTFNVGKAYKEDEDFYFTIDIRFPVTMHKETVMEALNKSGAGNIVNIDGIDPLFFPLEHPMIKSLYKAYVDVTGDKESKPLSIGGGTYAKDMHNIVAFGCDDGKYNYHIHDDNEFVTAESLMTQTACYYQAILNLLEI
ncbi:MAG: Sapep family Mn(2+)-dependent dipeptidase [Erysipelotrichia bacterium]|nr:Sapep family Mn(2+)-dependent dipeptidase [Erysipelotrichia bacterium]